MDNEIYDEFPLYLVLFCIAVNISIYIVGAYLIVPLGKIFVALYLLYCLWMEIRVLIMSCRDCYYYGRLCAFGRGKICSLFLGKGSPERFRMKKITWINLVPDFLVSIIPLVIGGFYLVQSFTWLRLSLIVVLVIMAFPVTGFVRGSISCKFCRQREMGCPAVQLFAKKPHNA
jgi:hypothetical protein